MIRSGAETVLTLTRSHLREDVLRLTPAINSLAQAIDVVSTASYNLSRRTARVYNADTAAVFILSCSFIVATFLACCQERKRKMLLCYQPDTDSIPDSPVEEVGNLVL